MMQCPTCGNEFERISRHWGGGCPYPSISDRQQSVLEGILLSGATVDHGGAGSTSYRCPGCKRKRPFKAIVDDWVTRLSYPSIRKHHGEDVFDQGDMHNECEHHEPPVPNEQAAVANDPENVVWARWNYE